MGETLNFAAACRTPQNRIVDVPRDEWAKYMASVMMNIFGLCKPRSFQKLRSNLVTDVVQAHTKNTKVGDDFVRGVSGGERKRVSIAEMALAGRWKRRPD